MTVEEFNRKWDKETYTTLMERKDDWAEEYTKYLEDCYSMYEDTGFAPTFKSVYSSYPDQYGSGICAFRRRYVSLSGKVGTGAKSTANPGIFTIFVL